METTKIKEKLADSELVISEMTKMVDDVLFLEGKIDEMVQEKNELESDIQQARQDSRSIEMRLGKLKSEMKRTRNEWVEEQKNHQETKKNQWEKEKQAHEQEMSTITSAAHKEIEEAKEAYGKILKDTVAAETNLKDIKAKIAEIKKQLI